jgi:asparagine synthase (glutamine-hydrolysing)
MAEKIYHRGPDDDGFLELPEISLGMRRLAVVDIETGKQPISNETNDIHVVFNGEIYNHIQIRKDLMAKGHQFRTDHADTEIVVHAYEEYGSHWPEKVQVNGMYALALWDHKNKRLLLYRDRMGKKPLYYAMHNNNIIFASEIKALLCHPDISTELDPQALYHYFMLKHISAPETAYTHIRQLPAGHFLVWEKGKPIRTAPYWFLSFQIRYPDLSEQEASHMLLELLDDAVSLRMDCDVPYGAYLSGGMDSTAVTALMCKRQSKPVKTFCLGYAEEAKGQFFGKSQDFHYARTMADRLGTDHHELIIDAKQFAQSMPEIIRAFDQPFSGTISTFYLSTLIKKHVKVALSGDGADELFGSYLAHRLAFPIEYYFSNQLTQCPSWEDLEEKDFDGLKPFDNKGGFDFLKTVAHPDMAKWKERLCVFPPDELDKLLSREIFVQSSLNDWRRFWMDITKGLTATDALNSSLETDQRDLLPNQILPFVDRLSMAHSVEVRCPYLDHRLVAFANGLPGHLKIKNGITKYIHKKALEGLLPQDLLNRPKEGFVQPIYTWMHDSLHKWTLEWLHALPQHWFDGKLLGKLISEFQSGDTNLNAKIWNLVCFSIWFHQNCR